MTKVLKLGFAMGGGVSLGTFSGAALTEAIKLAILYGRDEDGNPYDDIEIDIFSGASAGSMSLCILLRGLVHQTDEQRDRAEDKLRKEYGSEFDQLEDKKKEQLIVAQVAQDIQEDIWVKEININKLLGKQENTAQKDLKLIASLLDRGAVDSIARDYFDMSDLFSDGNFNFQRRTLLTDRVLFASTLTNLSKIQYDARLEFNDNELNNPGLKDGLTSNGHKELRVFDLYFKKIKKSDLEDDSHPDRWCRYHLGGETENYIGDLKRQRTWSKIIATSIACGSFPFAFEPVVLKRADYEYQDVWPKYLKDKNIKEFPFSYVDGGTLNNEPIREAFRMASFMDATEIREFDRRIIFVDPSVEVENANLNLPIHKKFKIESPNSFGLLDGYDLIKLSSLDRLVPQFGNILTVIMNEARLIEKDKIFAVRKKFEGRNEYRRFLKDILKNVSPTNKMFENLYGAIKDKLTSDTKNLMMPSGSLHPKGELQRVIIEEEGYDSDRLEDIQEFIESENSENDPSAKIWLRYYFYIVLDLIMDMSGKNENAKVIAIAPVVEKDGELKVEPLPGRYLSGFAGFMSSHPNKYAVKLAKHCTRFFLEKQDIIKRKPGGLPEYPRFNENEAYLKDVKRGLEDLSNRIQQIVKDSHFLNITSLVDKSILFFINRFVNKSIEKIELTDDPIKKFTFKIEVPGKKFEINGRRLNSDLPAQKIDNKYYLITELDFHTGSDWNKDKRWESVHINEDDQVIRIDTDRFSRLPDKNFCTIKLPDFAIVEKAMLMPNPIFEIAITSDDQGKKFSNEVWSISTGVRPLEETII